MTKLNLRRTDTYKFIGEVSNSTEINNLLTKRCKLLMTNSELMSKHLLKEIYELVLRDLILSEIDSFNIETNHSHIVTLQIGATKYIFNIVKYDSRELGKGYNISKTLLA